MIELLALACTGWLGGWGAAVRVFVGCFITSMLTMWLYHRGIVKGGR